MLSPATVVGKQQIEKKHKKTLKKIIPENDKSDRLLVQKNETNNSDNKMGKKQNPSQTSSQIFDLNDFPKLRTSDWSCNFKNDAENHHVPKNQKSWFSVVNSDKRSHLNERVGTKKSFPVLPRTRVTEEGEASINSQREKSAQNAVLNECIDLKKDTSGDGQKHVTSEAHSVIKNHCFSIKASVQSQRNPNKKKRADPIFLNLQEILQITKSNKKIKHNRVLKTKFHRHKERECLSGNYLDSSNPKRSRGKHREIKKKRITNLKLSIIKERIIKQKIRESAVRAYIRDDNLDVINKIDFKTEIEKYISELNKRKIKRSECDNKNVKSNVEAENKHEGVDKKEENKQKSAPSLKTEVVPTVKTIKFSSKLREYCDNVITPDLNSAVTELVKELVNLQDKLFARDPIKAKIKRRHVSGIKEVKKHLGMKKVKLIVIAPNLEKLQMEGSVYDLIEELKGMANTQNVPYFFALDRYKLGRCTKKNVPVSAFAVLNYEGVESLFENVLHYGGKAKKEFAEMLKASMKEEEKPDVNSGVISSLLTAFREQVQINEEKVESDLVD